MQKICASAHTCAGTAGGRSGRVYDLFPRLKERAWQQAGTLSGGEQQMLAVGRALMAKPKLIMMDEPSLGLAPIVVRGIFEIIREINRQGITVLLIEQNANMALKIADWAYVMQTGSILMRARRRAGRQRGGQGRVSRHGKIKEAIPGSRRGFLRGSGACGFSHLFLLAYCQIRLFCAKLD